MNTSKRSLRKRHKNLSIFILFCFLVSQFSGDATRAFAQPEVYDQIDLQSQTPSLFQGLPSKVGSIKKIWRPAYSAAPFVVIIQDAHANPEAQSNIKKLLEWFREKNLSNKSADGKAQTLHIALENLSGTLYPKYFDFFPSLPEANQSAIDYLTAKGELTGPELFAWEMYRKENKIPADVQMQGVENAALYKENLRIFRSLLFQEEPIKQDLETIEVQLNKSAGLLLSEDLFDFLKEKQKRKEGQYGPSGNDAAESGAQLGVYLHFLETSAAEKLKINLNDKIEQIRFPGLSRWKAAESLDKEIARDPSRYRSAWQRLLESLVKSANSGEKYFLESSFSNWASNPAARAIAENLLELVQKYSPESGDIPDALKLIERWVLISEITPDLIMTEVDSLEAALINSLAKTDTDKKLMALLRDFSIFRDCLLLRLTERDFESMKTRKLILRGKSWRSRLEQDGKVKIEPKTFFRLNLRMKNAVRFYDGAKKRDSFLIERTIQESQGSPFTVLVAGGFHAAGMAQKLEEKNVPYALIQPAITKTDGGQLYASVMKGVNSKLPDGMNNDFFTLQQALILKSLIEVALPEALRRFPDKKELIFEGVKKYVSQENVFSPDIMVWASNFSNGMDLAIHRGNTTLPANSLSASSVFRPPLLGEAAVFADALPATVTRAVVDREAHYQLRFQPSGQMNLISRAEIRATGNDFGRSGRPRHRQVVKLKQRRGLGPDAPIESVSVEISLGGNRSLDFRLASEEYERGSQKLRRGPTPVTAMRHFLNKSQLNRNIGHGHFFSGQLNHTEYGDGALISGFDGQLPIFAADLNQQRSNRILAGNKITRIGGGPSAVERKLSEMKKNIENPETPEEREELPAYLAFHIDDVLVMKRGQKNVNGHYEPEYLDQDRWKLMELLIWFIEKDVPIAFLSNNDSTTIQKYFLGPLSEALVRKDVQRALPIYFYTNGLTNHGLLGRTADGWAVTPHVSDYGANIRIPRWAVEMITSVLGEVAINDEGHVRLGTTGLLPTFYRSLTTHNGINFTPSASLRASFPDLAIETTQAGDMTPPEIQISRAAIDTASGDADLISIRHLISYASAANGESESAQRINLGESEYDPRERLLAAIAAELIEQSENLATVPHGVTLAPGSSAKRSSEIFNLDVELLLGAPIDEHTVVTKQIILNLRKLFGVEDLVTSQLPAGLALQEEQKNKAAARMLKAIRAMQLNLISHKTPRQVFNLETLDRRNFLARFGTQSLFRVSTEDVQFSTIIPRSFARGKLAKPDTAYALSGYYKSPETQPIVILNHRVLGHLLKPEYLKSVDPVKMIFEFTDEIPIQQNQETSAPIVIDPKYLDAERVYHYLGIPPAYMLDGTAQMNAVFIYNKTNQGDGEELAAVARLIKKGLPHRKDFRVKFLQRARTDHPTVALDTYSNVSFMTYLELLANIEETPEKSSKAVIALQPLKLNATGKANLRGETIPFYDVTGELMGLYEWNKIPHGDAVHYDSKKYTPETDYVYYKYSVRGRLEAVKRELDELNLKFKLQQIKSDEYQSALHEFFEKNRDFFSHENELLAFTDLNGKIPGTVSYVEKQLRDLRNRFIKEEMQPDDFYLQIQAVRQENPFFTISADGYLLTRELIMETIEKISTPGLSREDRNFIALHFKTREESGEFLVATRFNSFDLDTLSQVAVASNDPKLTTSFIELLGQMRHHAEVVDYGEPLPQRVRTIKDHNEFEGKLLGQSPFERSLPSMTARTNAVESLVERLKIILVREDSEADFSLSNLQRAFVGAFGKLFDSDAPMSEYFNNFEAVIRTLLAESYNQTWQFLLIDLLLNMVEFDNDTAGFSELWKEVPGRELRLSIIRFRIRALLAEAVDTGTLATQAEGGYLISPRYAQVTARLKNYFSKIHNAAAEDIEDGQTSSADYILERLADVVTEQLYRAAPATIEEHLRLRREVFGYSNLSQPTTSEYSVVQDGKSPVNKVFAFTGGTLLQAAYSKTFALMGLFDLTLEDFEGFFSYVANTDDGGHSYAIVKSFIDAMYGVLVALGDIGNSLSGFVSPDKKGMMGNDGRIPADSNHTQFAEAVRYNIWKTIADPAVAAMNPDYFMFSHAVLDLMRELDELNAQIKHAGKEPLKIPKSSLRNLFSAALIFQAGLIRRRSNAETPMIAASEEIKQFEEAIQRYVDLVGAHHYHGSITSFDPKTLFAIYEGYTLRLKDNTGRIESLVLTPKKEDGKIIGLSVKNPQPVSKIILKDRPTDGGVDKVDKAAFSRRRTAVDISLKPGESIRVDDNRLETAFTDTPIEISLDSEGFVHIQIEGKSFTLVENDEKAGYTLTRNEAYYKKAAGAEKPNVLTETAPDPEASALNYTYLLPDDGTNKIFLSMDGTGRRAEWAGVTPDKDNADEMAKQALFELGNGMRVNLISRVVKSQSFITEFPHNSRIIHYGLLHKKRGLRGLVPKWGHKIVLNPNPLMFKELDANRGTGKPDFGFYGPGSPGTSVGPIFLVEGIGEVLADKKNRGDKMVLVLNSTYDNESANWGPFEIFWHFQEALSRSSANRKLGDIYSDIVLLEMDPRIPADFINALDAETEKIKAGDPNLSDYRVDEIAFTKLASQINPNFTEEERREFVELLLALYPRIEPEERFDLSAASHAAKKARGPMSFTEQDFIEEIEKRVTDETQRAAEIDLFRTQHIWRSMRVHFLPPSALVVQEEKARVPGETEYRAVFKPEAIAKVFKTIIETPPTAPRNELRVAGREPMPRIDLTASTETLRGDLSDWQQTVQFPDPSSLLLPAAGIYRPYQDLARSESISDAEALARLLRALLNPSLKNTSVGKNILKTAKVSLGKFGFLLDRLSEQPVHLGGVIGDSLLTRDSEDFANLLILLELASQEKFSMTYLVSDDDGKPGIDLGSFTNRLRNLSESWGISPAGVADRLRFLPMPDSDDKAVVRAINQDFSKPAYRDSARGVLHDSLELLGRFGYQKTLARIDQSDIDYQTAILVSASLIREKLGEASILNLRKEIQRLGGIDALVSSVASMISNIRKVSQAA